MKLAKKSIAMVAAMSFIASMALTGCNEKSSKKNPEPTAEVTKEPEATKEAEATKEPEDKAYDTSEPVTITWYQIGTNDPEDLKKVMDAANKYIADNTDLNCTLDMHFYDYGAYPDKLQTMISAGEEFDICFTCSWANDYVTQASKGAYVALNDDKDLLGTFAPKTKELLGEGFLSGSQIEGINYAIPANKEKAHQWGLVYLKDVAEKYNMDFSNVKTLADMEPFFQKVKEGEGGNMYAFESLSGESPFRLLDFDRIGGDQYPGVVYNDDATKVFNEFEAPETEAFFELMHKFYQAGYIRADAATITDYTVDQKAGKMFAATRSLKPGKAEEESKTFSHQYAQLELTAPIISNRETMGSMEAVSSTSKHPERALMLLELFNTDPEFNNIINFGVEGSHYVKNSNGTISAGPDAAKYTLNLGWALGNQFINYLWDSEDPEKWSKFEEFNQSASTTHTLGFVFKADNVQSQIANCSNVWQQYIAFLETGSVDPKEVLPEAIEAFKAAGADDIVAEKQQQLEAWQKATGTPAK